MLGFRASNTVRCSPPGAHSTQPCSLPVPPRTGSSARLDSRRHRRPLAAAAARSNGASPGGSGSSSSVSRGGVVLFPGFFYSSQRYAGMAEQLRRHGFATEVVPIATSDWLPTLRGDSFEWYLQRADATVQRMHERHGRVAVVGHSAGGWIARLLLGGQTYQGVRYGLAPLVHSLVTLGAPHQSIEAYPFGRIEEGLFGQHLAGVPPAVTGSSLQFANHFYPTAKSLGGGVRVVCACGHAVRGRTLWDGRGLWGSSSASSSGEGTDGYASVGSLDGVLGGGGLGSGCSGGGGRLDEMLAYNAYKAVCGRGDVEGDGVTPLCISQLPGAEPLVLPGVWHLPRRTAGQLWYGDSAVIDQWQPYLLDPAGQARGSGSGSGAQQAGSARGGVAA